MPPSKVHKQASPAPQTVPHVPQFIVVPASVSHPSAASALQSAHPGAHEPTVHEPLLHFARPLMIGLIIWPGLQLVGSPLSQRQLQLPQFIESER